MKRFFLSLLLVLAAAPGSTAGEINTGQMLAESKATGSLQDSKKGRALRQVTFRVMGLGCGACIKRVEGLLQNEKGVLEAKIELYPKGQTTVTYNPARTSLEKVKGVIFKEDYAIENVLDVPLAAKAQPKVADRKAKAKSSAEPARIRTATGSTLEK